MNAVVKSCSVFEADMQIVTGAVGGIVVNNYRGIVENCDIGLSSILCEDDYAGGIVGLNESGYVTNNKVINDQVTIGWNGGSSSSSSLAPEIGIVVGRAVGGSSYIYGNTANGEVDPGGLTSSQAKYAQGEEVGRYVYTFLLCIFVPMFQSTLF